MLTPQRPTVLPHQVPPGAIGHNRGVVARNHAVIPPEGVLVSRLPEWPGAVVRFLAGPALGAGFAQFVLELPVGAGVGTPLTSDVQHFFYVLDGEARIAVGADAMRDFAAGGYAYVPPGTPFCLTAQSACRVLVVKKRWQPAAGLDVPPAFVRQRDDAVATNHTGLQGRGFIHFTGHGDLRHDFEMNLMFFDPGTCFPAVKTHIMEHGLYMLEGQGLYFLDRSWHEVWAGDFIWMGAFCPQQFYPTGYGRTAYLLYKNVNRDVLL